MSAASLTAPPTYPSLKAAWVPLAALCLAFFVEMVDNTLLSIALPTIGRDLGGDTTSLQWNLALDRKGGPTPRTDSKAVGLVTIDGVQNRQACMVPVHDGMTISSQSGARTTEEGGK